MTLPLRPNKGGFLRPFGCGWFIREFLLGHGPEGTPTIVPTRGACQADIFYHYKGALIRAYAEDAVAYENDERVRRRLPIYTPEEYEERVAYHLKYIPYKLTAARYHSFRRYFHWLKQLEWVEFTGEEETSSLQEVYPPGPPRRYYRLTRKGIEAPDYEWSRPQLALYPEIKGQPGLEYFRENRKKHHYSTKSRTKRRERV